MSDIGKSALKTKIDAKIYDNESQLISGTILNEVLQDAVDTLADGGNLDEGSVDTANLKDEAVTKGKLAQNVSADLDWAVASNSYYRNSQAGNVAAKEITTNKNMSLIGGGSLKVTFEQVNTADDATLNIDGKGAKPLYYNGVRVSSTNSWAAGETVEIYYNNYASGIYYAKRWMVEPVSVSQNTSTGHVDINVGGETTPVPSVEETDALKSSMTEFANSLQTDKKDTLYITDLFGNIVSKTDKEGTESIEFKSKGRKLSKCPLPLYDNKLYVTDAFGYCIAEFGADGLKVIDVDYPNKVPFDWKGKCLSTYGDSVSAENNGDYEAPFTDIVTNWGNNIANYHRFAKQFGRGIGSQGYKWNTGVGNGGSVAWVTKTGVLINRLDTFNYDNWDGETYPSGVTAEMEQSGDAIRIRGCLSSWLRITKMFPVGIKEQVNVILVMAHNDGYDGENCSFVPQDNTDTEWAASGSDYYGKIGGDYNITTFKGAVASTIMKLQMWMPNAVIVLMTGISGQGTAGEINTDINAPSGLNKAEAIREMSKLTSIPCIDTYASCGINGWNRTAYIADTIHPNSTNGRIMFARAINGMMKTILPKENIV